MGDVESSVTCVGKTCHSNALTFTCSQRKITCSKARNVCGKTKFAILHGGWVRTMELKGVYRKECMGGGRGESRRIKGYFRYRKREVLNNLSGLS